MPTERPFARPDYLLINKYELDANRAPQAPRGLRLAFSSLGRLAPEPAARMAERLYFSPRRYPVPHREHAWLEDSERTRVDTEVGALHITTWSPSVFPWERTRGTVILAHGWEGRGSQMGAFAKPLVDKGFVVVAPDAPAHGRSPGSETDLFTYARCLHTLMDRYGDVRAVVAHSAGAGAGYLLLEELARHGASLEAMALVAPPSDFRWIAATFVHALGIPETTAARFHARVEARLGKDIWQRFSLDAMAHLLTPAGLVIHDEDDDEMPIAHAETLVARWANAELVRTQGLGHRRILREPQVVERVVAFLDAKLT